MPEKEIDEEENLRGTTFKYCKEHGDYCGKTCPFCQIAELRTIEKVVLDTIEVISKDYKNIKDFLRIITKYGYKFSMKERKELLKKLDTKTEETIICQCNSCKSKRRTKKKENIKSYIEFIRFQYKDLIKHEGVCKKEDCLKIREMLFHILEFKPKTETGKLLECHGCGVVIPDHRYWCFGCITSSKKQFKEGYKQTLDNIIEGFIIIVKELKLAFKEKVLELKDFTEAETIVNHLRKD